MAEERLESIELQGVLKGHGGWVTCIATTLDAPNIILTGSRDKSIIVWELKTSRNENDGRNVVEGRMKRRLSGHAHFIQDIDISSDRQYALSSSWDHTLRLWNLKTGETTKRFIGHESDVLSVAFSADNRQIVSGGRDKAVKVWNTIGVCKNTLRDDGGHKDWVTCVRFSPNVEEPVIVSCGRDKTVKVWELKELTLKHNLVGHTSYVNSVAISPDGSLCASGGKDGLAILWDLNEGKPLSTLEANDEINALCFSPNRYWLCGAVGGAVKIWDLETKDVVGKLIPKEFEEKHSKKRKGLQVLCTSLAWSHDGKTLYAGYTDNVVRIWSLMPFHP